MTYHFWEKATLNLRNIVSQYGEHFFEKIVWDMQSSLGCLINFDAYNFVQHPNTSTNVILIRVEYLFSPMNKYWQEKVKEASV